MKSIKWRIGNYYLFNNSGSPTQCKWTNIEENMNFMKPILLNEDWADKFNLLKITGTSERYSYKLGYYSINEQFYLSFKKNIPQIVIFDEGYLIEICDCEYVHDLQNCVLYLTGQELTIKN